MGVRMSEKTNENGGDNMKYKKGDKRGREEF